ncbi:MAG TPA: hypothetical protein DDY91_06005 [Planctomycetaceae bacterium]|jgi:chromosome segregation ATPase|nr:hypothetical protein [Planctomycetaceae bacterium]
MLKKSLIAFAVAGTLGTLAFGRDLSSYLRTAGGEARQALKSGVPIEFEIQRARDMVESLIPEVRTCMHVIAEEEVNIDHLNREIAKAEVGLERQKGEILTMRKDLESSQATFQYASRRYTADEVRGDLAQRFQRFKTAEATLASQQEIRRQRERSLVSAREKLEAMLNEKRTMEVEIEHLEARLKQVQAAQAASHLSVDDSGLSRARQLITELNKQLDVETKVLDAQGQFTGLIPVSAREPAPADLARQIDQHFGTASTTQGAVAAERVANLGTH